MTHFLDQRKVEYLLSNLDYRFEESGIPDELFDFQGFQFQRDIRSFAQIVRETFNHQPWMSASEKSLRPFLHLQVPLPLGGRNSITNLENLGFVFLHDIVDYSYQDQGHLTDRCRGLEKNLINWSARWSLDDLYDIALENQDIYQHNFELIASGKLFSFIKSRFQEQFDN
jgi:hypothetical protein